MARDHAQIRLDMWGDDDWRDLSVPAQHLYMLLLTSPTLNFCGVVDWRPARIARLAQGWTPSAVEKAADELQDGLFLIVDVETEEALIRSFVRHDGLMKSPNMATAMSTDHAAIASPTLRGIVVHELQRLRDKHPDLAGWRSTKALAVLERNAIDPRGNPSVNPSGKGSVNPSVNPDPNPSVNPCPTPAPTPAPSSSSSSEEEKSGTPRKRGARISEDFTLSEETMTWAMDRGFAPAHIAEIRDTFVDHWAAASGSSASKLDWDRAFKNWMRKEDPARPPKGQLSLVSADRRLTTAELENLLGMDVWTCPSPPRDLDDDAQFAWMQKTIRAHADERQQQARERMGRAS